MRCKSIISHNLLYSTPLLKDINTTVLINAECGLRIEILAINLMENNCLMFKSYTEVNIR